MAKPTVSPLKIPMAESASGSYAIKVAEKITTYSAIVFACCL
jgi:hypothetical protein